MAAQVDRTGRWTHRLNQNPPPVLLCSRSSNHHRQWTNRIQQRVTTVLTGPWSPTNKNNHRSQYRRAGSKTLNTNKRGQGRKTLNTNKRGQGRKTLNTNKRGQERKTLNTNKRGQGRKGRVNACTYVVHMSLVPNTKLFVVDMEPHTSLDHKRG